MSQLIRITFQRTVFLNFKCPYHAAVIKMFEIVRRMMVFKRAPEVLLKRNHVKGGIIIKNIR
jgi:hypothetical protein